MSRPVLDFDEVAADDALIESIRSGADPDELPSGDAGVAVLLSLRDGADEPAGASAPTGVRAAQAVLAGVTSHRRSIAVSVVVGVVATAGVGTAVAGDPTAAFTYVFRHGIEIGSRFGTPGGDADAGALDGIDHRHPAVGASSVPVRQGMSAARSSDDGTRDPVGFERESHFWTVPAPRGLESISGDRRDSVRNDGRLREVDGYSDTVVDDHPSTGGPEESESPGPEATTTPPDEDGVQTAPETTDPPPDDGATTLTTPPEETTAPPPDQTTEPPPETTMPPPEETTSPPPETTTPPPTETTTPTTEPPSESPTSTETSPAAPPSESETPSSSSPSPSPD